MVNSTKMNLRSSQAKVRAIDPVVNSPTVSPSDAHSIQVNARAIDPVVNSPTASPSDVEVVEPVAGSSTAADHTEVSNASTVCVRQLNLGDYADRALVSQVPSLTPSSARPIHSGMFNDVFLIASGCRKELKAKYQIFLRELDSNASHCGHLIEPPTVETQIPISVQRPVLRDLLDFLRTAADRTSWETVKDLQETEVLVFQTLGRINSLLKASPVLDKSEADIIMGHFATVATTNDAFCTRLSARLMLTPEQSAVFDESDLMNPYLLCFRLVATSELPTVDDRFRLLWAVGSVHAMRIRFLDWNNALSRRCAALKAQSETLSANIDDSKTETRGLKRKAEEEVRTDS
jgi:hypothetical protein